MSETIDPERYNEAVMQAAILNWVMAALDGEQVCDFAESFSEVVKAQRMHHALSLIAKEQLNLRGCQDWARLALGKG